MPRPIGLLVPTRRSDSRQCGPFTCNLVEGVAVNDPHVLSIPELNDTPRGQGSKRSANSLKRHSDVSSDVREIHRQRDFRDLLAFGNVELFDELQKHRELSDGSPLAKQMVSPFLNRAIDDMCASRVRSSSVKSCRIRPVDGAQRSKALIAGL